MGVEQARAATATFYRQWKAKYLQSGACGADRLYVAHLGNASSPPSISVSEGQGWGMLALALMAADDLEAKGQFDAMLRFVHDYSSAGQSGLMAWDIYAPCQARQGACSATDADLDIACALLVAGRA